MTKNVWVSLALAAALGALLHPPAQVRASDASGDGDSIANKMLAGLPDRFRKGMEVVPYEAPALRVVSADGAPVTSATLVLMPNSGPFLETTATHAGGGRYLFESCYRIVSKTRTDTCATYTLLAAAPGFVPTTTTIELRERSATVRPAGDVTVRLAAGRRVALELTREDGGPLPDSLVPLVADTETLEAVWCSLGWGEASRRVSIYPATRELPGRWVFHVGPGRQSVFVVIDHPGLLRQYVVGPLAVEAAETTALSVSLPRPWAIHAQFKPAPGVTAPAYRQCTLSVSRTVFVPGGRPSMYASTIISTTTEAQTLEAVFDDLPPPTEESDFWVSGDTTPHRADGLDGEYSFRDGQSPDFRGGTTASVEILYKPLDLAEVRGDLTAVVHVSDAAGKPAAGHPYTILWYPRHYPEVVLTSGTVPSSGILEISGLGGAPDKEMTFNEAQRSGFAPPRLHFVVDDKAVGSIGFFDVDTKTGRLRPVLADGRREFQFRLPLKPGDDAPDIELTDLADGRRLRLSDLRGQVVYLDFWATWCGPCQRPMHKLDTLARSRAADWAGKVALLGVSVDDTTEVVVKHLKERQWTSARQTWCHPEDGNGGRNVPQVRAFQVTSFPTAFLLDRHGKVVWTGRPGESLEDLINKALDKP